MQDFRWNVVYNEKGITMKRFNHLLPLLQATFISGLLTGCMTIFSPSSETILINRPTAEPVTIITASDTLVAEGQPIALSLKKKHLNKPIQIASEEYEYQTLIPGRRTAWWAILADLYFTEGVGLIVDYSSGAIYHPRQKSYYVKAARKDTLRSKLPVADHRAPSPFKTTIYNAKRHYRHELRLGLSIGNTLHDGCFDRMSQRVADRLHLNGYMDELYCGLGAVTNFAASLSYYYHLNDRWAVGMIAGTGTRPNGYEGYMDPDPNWKQGWPSDWPTDTPPEVFVGNMESTSWFFLPSAKYYWGFTPGARVYSKAAVGLMSQHNWFEPFDLPNDTYFGYTNAARKAISEGSHLSERRWHLAGQLSPFGVEVGSSWLRFFVELGYGMEGIFTMGWSCHF